MHGIIDLFAQNLTERAEPLRQVGDAIYVRPIAGDKRVLKITALPGVDEVQVTLQLIHPSRGVIDTASFNHTRAQKSEHALLQLDAFLGTWFYCEA